MKWKKFGYRSFFIILAITISIELIVLSIYYFSYFNIKAEEFKSDPAVKEVVSECNNSSDKVECVFDSFPFIWKSRGIFTESILSPTQIEQDHYAALCRDIAVARKSIFDSLGIKSEFVYEPTHIYVRAYENGKIYELNNQYIYTVKS